MDLNKPLLLALENFENPKGSTTVLQDFLHDNFSVKRIYYISNSIVSERGHHGHKKLAQVILSLKNDHLIKLHDGEIQTEFYLRAQQNALYIPPGYWREISLIKEDSIIFVLGNEKYSSDDYIEKFSDFIEWHQK